MRCCFTFLAAFLTLFAYPTHGRAEIADTKAQQEQYVRVSQTEQGQPKNLETAIVRFEGTPKTDFAGITVDLVGVVHIGGGDYYAQLDRRLAEYDVVLYELVAPDGTRIRPEDLAGRRSLIASMQSGMRDVLKLEYQLERINYLAENFRHADMSPEEFAEDMARRGDSLPKMIARLFGASLAMQASGKSNDLDLIRAFFSKDRPVMLRRAMAAQLADMEMLNLGLDDADGENTIIKGRNAKAMRILAEEVQAGQKNIAIFYGAGHLPDMAERLRTEFAMKASDTIWLPAWNLQDL